MGTGAGKEPEEVKINLRDTVKSRLDHSFLAAGNPLASIVRILLKVCAQTDML